MSRAPTGHIRRLASGRYQARYTFPDGVRRPAPLTFQTKRDATAWLHQTHADISRNQWTPIKATMGTTFEKYADDWLKDRMVNGHPLALRTVSGYKDLLDRFVLPTFGHLPVHTLSRDEVNRWYKKTATTTPTYRARAYSLLRAILTTAVDDGHLSVNPCHVRGAGSSKRVHKVEPATPEELETITAAMPERYRLMVLLAAFCALRFGELTELRRKDIDKQKGALRVTRAVVLVDGEFTVKGPKSDAGERDVSIPPHLLPLVFAHLLQHTAPGPDGLLFPSKADPTRHLRQSSLARVFYPARAAAGRPDLRFHDLRHTGAVYAAEAGATMADLMARLGHSTASASIRYQHAAKGRDSLIAALMSEKFAADALARSLPG
jgi:integrase